MLSGARKTSILVCGPFPQDDVFGGIASMMESYRQNESLFDSAGMSVTFQESAVNCRGRQVGTGRVALLRSMLAPRYFRRAYSGASFDVVLMSTSRGYTLFRDLRSLLSLDSRSHALKCVFFHHVNDFDAFLSPLPVVNRRISDYIKKLDICLFLSRSTMDSFVSAGVVSPEKCRVISTFHSYPKAPGSHIDSEKAHVLFMGHLREAKGVNELVRASKSFAPDKFVFDICGNGDEAIERELRELSQSEDSCIAFHGYVKGAQKESLYRAAKVFLLPSYAEGMPVSMLEAMHFGCVPVVTGIGAVPEVIADGNGVLIESKNVQSIVDGVRYALNNYDLLSEGAKATSSRYSLESHIELIADALRQKA